ncbi:MAG: hypothetical protein IT210_26635 [Armatimonadetes bacterium]|nr:hypothetical protein [Armatimonadota bacterium]
MLTDWHAGYDHILFGATGGLISLLGHNRDVLPLPRLVRQNGRQGIYLGFLSSLMIGAFCGYVVNHHPVLTGAAGYLGIKLVDSLVRRLLPDTQEGPPEAGAGPGSERADRRLPPDAAQRAAKTGEGRERRDHRKSESR